MASATLELFNLATKEISKIPNQPLVSQKWTQIAHVILKIERQIGLIQIL